MLVIHADGLVVLFVEGFALIKPVVVQPAAVLKLVAKSSFLLAGRKYSVLEGFSHKNII